MKCAVCRASGRYAGHTCPWCDGSGRYHWWDSWQIARASDAEALIRSITRHVQALRTTAQPGEAYEAARELEAEARRLLCLFSDTTPRPATKPSPQPKPSRPRGRRKGRPTGWRANRAWLTAEEYAVVEAVMRKKAA